MSMSAPLLLPTPLHVEFTGERVALPAVPTRESLPFTIQRQKHSDSPEAYTLRIGRHPESIQATGNTLLGERHARATLDQLIRQYGTSLPVGEVRDAPSFAVRGLMLDVSRDKVPTMAQLTDLVVLMSALKFNHLQLYTEHTFAYAGHEDAWRDASPITPSEARWLSQLCAGFGIELCPNQNCFGHLAHWLKQPRYEHLSEIQGHGVWKFLHWERRGPFSLCPTEPRSLDFVSDLLHQLTPNFPHSRSVNIGCDETFDVGFGRSLAAVNKRAAELVAGGSTQEAAESGARAELYTDFVRSIARVCNDLDRRPMMWSDIALSHPEQLARLPKNMLGLAWWYEPTEKFEQWVTLLRNAGLEAWVCPGTSSWRSITGRTNERRGNLADAAEQGLRAGAIGYLACDWGDLGHRQQWPIALMGIAHAAHAAWNAPAARSFDAQAASLHVLADPTLTLGPWLERLGDADLPIRQAVKLTNATALFNDLHPPVPAALKPGERCIKAELPLWSTVRARLGELESATIASTDARIAAECQHALTEAVFACDHAMIMRKPHPTPAERAELAARCARIRAEHEKMWLMRNRPGGLAHASSYYDALCTALSV